MHSIFLVINSWRMALSIHQHNQLLSFHLSKKKKKIKKKLVFVDFINSLAHREKYYKFYHKKDEKN